MLSLFKRYRELLIVGALLLYPLATFLSSGHKGRDPNFVDRVVPMAWPDDPPAGHFHAPSSGVGTVEGAVITWASMDGVATVRLVVYPPTHEPTVGSGSR